MSSVYNLQSAFAAVSNDNEQNNSDPPVLESLGGWNADAWAVLRIMTAAAKKFLNPFFS